MKAFLLIPFFASLILMGCQQPVEQNKQSNPELELPDVNKLTSEFIAGWNNHDSAAVRATISDEAVLVNDSIIRRGVEDIAANWISGGVKVLSNIKTTSASQGASEHIAFDAGTYTLDLLPPGGPLLKERGNYTLIWHKNDAGDWKLTHLHIEDVSRMPDVAAGLQ